MGELPPDNSANRRTLRKDAERNRDLLIAAGAELFQAPGEMATLDDVARRAGVGVATAYRHFPNKFVLAQAVLSETIEEMLTAAERASEMDDAVLGMTSFLEAVLEPQASKRALGKLLKGDPKTSPAADDIQERVEKYISIILQRGRDQRTLRDDLAATDIGVLMTMMANLIETYGGADSRLWRRLLPVIVDGLRAGSPTPIPGTPLATEVFLRHQSGGS